MSEIRLEVVIDGRKYPLVSKESKERIEKIAAYVDSKIKEVKSDKLTLDRQFVLACLNIADDYLKEKNDFEDFTMTNQEAIEEYPRLREEFYNFKKEYGSYKSEIKEKSDEIEKLRELLRKKDEEILKFKTDAEELNRLKEETEDLTIKLMDMSKENESLKEKL